MEIFCFGDPPNRVAISHRVASAPSFLLPVGNEPLDVKPFIRRSSWSQVKIRTTIESRRTLAAVAVLLPWMRVSSAKSPAKEARLLMRRAQLMSLLRKRHARRARPLMKKVQRMSLHPKRLVKPAGKAGNHLTGGMDMASPTGVPLRLQPAVERPSSTQRPGVKATKINNIV
jgi:hypothetical protein